MFTFLLTKGRHIMRGVGIALVALLVLAGLPATASAVSTTEVVEMFKYQYGSDKMMMLASVEVVLWNLLKRKKREVFGRGQWILPIQTQNGGVFVGMAEGGTLTTRRAQPDTAEATFSLREFQAVWDVTWKMLRDASKSESAFEKAMDFMDASMRRRVFRTINAQLNSMTGLGELAVLPAADDATTITVNSLPFTDKGQYVDIMDASDNTTKLSTAVQIAGVSVPTREVYITGGTGAPAGSAANDFFVPADQITGGVSYSMLGLGAWLDDGNPPAVVGNIGGINRGTVGNEYWQGNVFSNGGTLRPMTEDLILQGEDQTRERGGKQVSRYLLNSAIARRYHGDLLGDRMFMMNRIQGLGPEGVGIGRTGVDLDGSEDGTGESIYTFSGKPVHIEPYGRANTILAWNDDHFFLGYDGTEVPTPLSEIFDDLVPFFTMTTSAKFDCWHYWQAQLLSDNPQAGCKWEDIAES